MSTLSAVSKCSESMKDFSRVNLTHYYRTLKYVSEVPGMKRYHFILLCIHVVLYVCTWCCVKCKATISVFLKKTLENHVCLHCHLKWHNDTYGDLFCSVCIQCSLIKRWPKCKRLLFFFFFADPTQSCLQLWQPLMICVEPPSMCAWPNCFVKPYPKTLSFLGEYIWQKCFPLWKYQCYRFLLGWRAVFLSILHL